MSTSLYSLFALSIILMTCYAGDISNPSTICAPSNCGNISIRYPFWRRSKTNMVEEFCGYSDFGLECLEGHAIITLPSDTYYVTEINYDSRSITLVEVDILNQPCPRAQHNVSLGNLPLSFSSLDLNLSFYFNCSSYPLDVDSIGCFRNSQDKNQSYVFLDGEDYGYEWNMKCEEHVVVTVKQDEIKRNGLITGFGAAMQKGFVLDWMRVKDCAECEMSGGSCGFNQNTKLSRCICRDGSNVAKSCKKGITSAAVLLICITIFCFRCKSLTWHEKFCLMTKVNQDIEAFLRSRRTLSLKRYKFSDVKKMTSSFKVKPGQGGFGAVYKGELPSNSPIAVKLLNSSKGNGEEFINEVASISRTSHINVITLLRFCLEGSKKALIYEFMANGSLDKFIYKKGQETIASLSLESLYQIAIGIAQGLEYLHKGCNTRILHFDIKPHSILLDENFCPKISNFGLAKLCPRNKSIVSMSDPRGTCGYLAPEIWNRRFGGVSHKSDVYSYGMILLDMVEGRKNTTVEASHSSETYFPDWIYNRLENCNLRLDDGVTTIEENETVRRMIIVGLWCIQTFPNDRPKMSRVIDMLEGSQNSLEIPPKPIFSSPTRSIQELCTT